MSYFNSYKDISKCWWCGSSDLSSEHKAKKTDVEMLYGKVYKKGDLVNHIKYFTEAKGNNIQSSNSRRIKFKKTLCKNCNGGKSQVFDLAYQRLIEYYFFNRQELKHQRKLNLEDVFGPDWLEEYSNVKRYIGKHIGCRMAELGFLPSKNLISFLNGVEENKDLKIVLQIKPYQLGAKGDPIDSIFIGPGNLINNSAFKFENLFTSFSGWYSIANFTWNYLHEKGISSKTIESRIINIDIVNYDGLDGAAFSLKEETLMNDWSNILGKLEYYPFSKDDRDMEHYSFMKKAKNY